MKRFAIIGAAGRIAPRHMDAIKAIGGKIVAVCDSSDSVGILDQYSHDISYFREFERFERYAEKIRAEGKGFDYVSICSPNYLHDAHIRFALRNGAHAICEKPLVISPWNLDALSRIEEKTHKKVYPVLQLRHHPEAKELRSLVWPKRILHVDVDYFIPRGHWYNYSWKGNSEKSGGLLMNIGIHIFDLIQWVFGKPHRYRSCNIINGTECEGVILTARAEIDWRLSLTRPSCRKVFIDHSIFDFSEGFDNLHTAVYQDIINGEGLGIEDARPAIELIHKLRGLS